MNTTSDNYTKATGDGWVEFFVDNGKHVVRAEAGREEGMTLLDTIAAAPALLAAAKNMVLAFDHGDADSEMDALRQIKEAIAEAAHRKVKHTVWVTVAVDVETTPGEASKPGNVCMAAIEAVRDGEGEIVRDEIIETN